MEEKLIESIEEVVLLSPEQWSKVILDLIEKGDWLNADNQYLEFAKHYPEHEFNKEYVKLKQRHAAGIE
jgi:outer membrane protein assembly factor BamD (BamD/ComL family)